MLKSIPKSDISVKKFPVHKEWIITDNEVPVIVAQNEVGLFDPNTSDKQSGVYTHPLYHSIKTKYYNAKGNVFNQYGIMRNPAEWEWERYFGDTIYVIKIPQLMYGEQIKKGSVVLTDLDNQFTTGSNSGSNIVYTDDSFGNIQSDLPAYLFLNYDAETQIMQFQDQYQTYDVVCSFFDVNQGIAVFSFDGDTDNYYITKIDFQTNVMIMDRPLIFNDTVIGDVYNGNVFYDEGLIVLTNITAFTNYELVYRSTQTIHETEVLITVKAGEFNFSQNPSAVTVILENEYDFEVTKITNSQPAGTVRIKEIQDISRKSSFVGSSLTGSNGLVASGSWDDYFEYATIDPTGSYLTTYISTIGLYDDNLNLVATAKLPAPIKNLPNYDLNFLIRFDT